MIVRFEILQIFADKGDEPIVTNTIETKSSINFRHLFWDEKIKIPLPLEKDKSSLRVSMLRKTKNSNKIV